MVDACAYVQSTNHCARALLSQKRMLACRCGAPGSRFQARSRKLLSFHPQSCDDDYLSCAYSKLVGIQLERSEISMSGNLYGIRTAEI